MRQASSMASVHVRTRGGVACATCFGGSRLTNMEGSKTLRILSCLINVRKTFFALQPFVIRCLSSSDTSCPARVPPLSIHRVLSYLAASDLIAVSGLKGVSDLKRIADLKTISGLKVIADLKAVFNLIAWVKSDSIEHHHDVPEEVWRRKWMMW